MVKTDIQQCQRVGRILSRYKVKPEFLNRPFLACDVPVERKINALFFAVAICHQTHALHNPVSGAKGWDHIEEAFLKMMLDNDPWLEASFLFNKSKEELRTKLAIMFSHDGKPENTTLDRLDERAGLMIDLSAYIVQHFHGQYSMVLSDSENLLLHDGRGYFEILEETTAFTDPQRKKSMFLFKLLNDAGLYEVTDKKNLIPVMDYHMQRVLLRSGCVVIENDELRRKLTERETLKSDEPVRGACIEAAGIIAETSGHGITAMNDFFWPMGRSCCLDNPVCVSGTCNKTPCTLSELTDFPQHTTCMLQDVCIGVNNGKLRNLYEPNVVTHYY